MRPRPEGQQASSRRERKAPMIGPWQRRARGETERGRREEGGEGAAPQARPLKRLLSSAPSPARSSRPQADAAPSEAPLRPASSGGAAAQTEETAEAAEAERRARGVSLPQRLVLHSPPPPARAAPASRAREEEARASGPRGEGRAAPAGGEGGPRCPLGPPQSQGSGERLEP
ncbi:Hypothetical predicted protein [Podarcis lilfordi]|uniref:Uncharacterized protein n=1 Tax=Podarcis lilfordi TaxID=74358 RepID=A0AA35PDB8_9SAUR|nr:Hypothetical predicted protein [Podarcis lilfordi]